MVSGVNLTYYAFNVGVSGAHTDKSAKNVCKMCTYFLLYHDNANPCVITIEKLFGLESQSEACLNI